MQNAVNAIPKVQRVETMQVSLVSLILLISANCCFHAFFKGFLTFLGIFSFRG